MEIRGSHVMITGCNRGIGKAVALMCAADGAHLHIVNRKADQALEEELTQAGAASLKFYQLDLSQRANIDQFLKDTKDLQIDILFNNAGLLTGGLLENQTVDEIYAMLQVNVNALIHLTHGFLPRMIARKRGKIINHASVTGVMHFPCATTYAASKAAVIAFTDSLRAELKGTGVTTLVLVTP
ncbi:MAG: SDR family NAD(P)-dependent oxidoreductase, partial [Pseudobdellovibrionaceae bacterium]